ncbi:soluble quino protein glucose dehydrogenase [Sarocladium strictum]
MMRFGLSALALVTAVTAVPSPLVERQSPFQETAIADLNEPWALAFLPDERVLVTERAGTLRLVDPSTSSTGEITGVPSVVYAGQGGLGDVAIHPNFEENNQVYISYVVSADGGASNAVVARGTLALNENGGGALEDLEVIWVQDPPISGSGHFSHRILFDSDGFMWISSGDRQQFDPAQDMSGNLGKILRLNDDGTVPEGNPFADEGGVAAQVWSLGVRNPLGIAFDAEGRLWEIEMGPQGGDELNLIQEGGNYGWPEVSEGIHYDGEDIPNHSTRPEFIPPKVAWVPSISPASVIVYKGDLFSDWTGNALIAALGQQGVVRVELDGEDATEAEKISMGRRIRTIREDPEGALWILEDGPGGRLVKLTPA